ncbi:MAG: methyltetrahydrofolate--corrinoid methyltransferase [Desulfobacteraceae bacterium]|nr:methyltetrahydrofolate--corrinoid methyltransferase [Desulfobacteraceae bacterium]
MLIIGEKINGTLKKTASAITGRDCDFIRDLALRQVRAGAAYLDVNAGTGGGKEAEDLVWLVNTVQDAVDVPLCLDSADPAVIGVAMAHVKHTPMINSISGEQARLDGILPLAKDKGSPVIALLLDDAGIPVDVEKRLTIAMRIIHQTRKAGLPDSHVYVDPLALAVSTRQDGALIALETIRALKRECPEIKFCMGLSNVSFGLPARTLVNQAFIAQAILAGLDAAIMNPMEQGLVNMIYATELVLGRDRFCRHYTQAFRSGMIDPNPAARS